MAASRARLAPMTTLRLTQRRQPRRHLATTLLVVVLLAGTLLPSLAQDASPTPGGAAVTGENIEITIPQKLGGAFNFGINQDVGTFDPIQPMSNMSLWTVMELYSRLVRVDKLGQDVEGDLAERWEYLTRQHRLDVPPAPGGQVLQWRPGNGGGCPLLLRASHGSRLGERLGVRRCGEGGGGRSADGQGHAEAAVGIVPQRHDALGRLDCLQGGRGGRIESGDDPVWSGPFVLESGNPASRSR